MAGPDVPAGRRVPTLTSLVDSAPTIMQCVGASPAAADADLPGRSLFDIVEGADPERSAFSEYHAAASMTGTFMLRDGNYKLVYFVGMEPQLFDLDADPDETKDLAKAPEHADALARLEAKLRAICDPEEVDKRARSDQAATIAQHGGRDEILKRGDFGYSPAPGQKVEFSA
jgi:arylsulfatase A-like enzyme